MAVDTAPPRRQEGLARSERLSFHPLILILYVQHFRACDIEVENQGRSTTSYIYYVYILKYAYLNSQFASVRLHQ